MSLADDKGKIEDKKENVTTVSTKQLFLQIPTPHQLPESIRKPTSAAVRDAKIRRREQIIQQHRSQTGKIVCGIFILVVMLGIGVGMVFLARIMDIPDLYIVGGIFLGGSGIFLLGFVVVRCQKAPADYKPVSTKPPEDWHNV